jgi:hypothetical protein
MHIPTSLEHFYLMRKAPQGAVRCFWHVVYIYLFGTSHHDNGQSVAYSNKAMAHILPVYTPLPSHYGPTMLLELCSQVWERCDVFGGLFALIWPMHACTCTCIIQHPPAASIHSWHPNLGQAQGQDHNIFIDFIDQCSRCYQGHGKACVCIFQKSGVDHGMSQTSKSGTATNLDIII